MSASVRQGKRLIWQTIFDMDIWNVQPQEWTQLILWQVDEETYKVVAPGDLRPLLTNPSYILIDQKYGLVFNALDKQVRCHPVKITDLVIKVEYQNYIRLDIQNTVDPTSILTQNSERLKVWRCNENIFVSGDLKRELMKISASDFSFSLGFSMFVG